MLQNTHKYSFGMESTRTKTVWSSINFSSLNLFLVYDELLCEGCIKYIPININCYFLLYITSQSLDV